MDELRNSKFERIDGGVLKIAAYVRANRSDEFLLERQRGLLKDFDKVSWQTTCVPARLYARRITQFGMTSDVQVQC